jgi:hypothetical protein
MIILRMGTLDDGRTAHPATLQVLRRIRESSDDLAGLSAAQEQCEIIGPGRQMPMTAVGVT